MARPRDLQGSNRIFSQNVQVTKTSVSNKSVLVMSDNDCRKGFMLFNDSANQIFISYGPSTDSYSLIIEPHSYYVHSLPVFYTGKISAIRSNPNTGNLIATEFV